ncbi:hypothetical protein LJB88_02565 [Erysipelotrichaceae bacterium OttesenSCG-928-M19]|nr:hypothetical protein [Erysipelotrichaceae bacterium OttesenSCG-928-M19]
MKAIIEEDSFSVHEVSSLEELLTIVDEVYPNKLCEGDLFYKINLEEQFIFGLAANDYGAKIKVARLDYDKYLIIESDTFYVIDLEKQDIFHQSDAEFIIDFVLLDDKVIMITDLSLNVYSSEDFIKLWTFTFDDLVADYFVDDEKISLTFKDSDQEITIDMQLGIMDSNFDETYTY